MIGFGEIEADSRAEKCIAGYGLGKEKMHIPFFGDSSKDMFQLMNHPQIISLHLNLPSYSFLAPKTSLDHPSQIRPELFVYGMGPAGVSTDIAGR